MTLFLAGGGDGDGIRDALAQFVGEVRDRADDRPARVAVVAVGDGAEPDDNAAEWAERLRAAAIEGGAGEALEVRPAIGRTDGRGSLASPVALDDLLGVDGLLIAGGHTPSYLQALAGVVGDIRRLVSEGVHFFGFSAGAALAADEAILGGWRIGGVAVCPESVAERLDEVTVEAGIGLVDLAVDAHTAQWGTLGRAVAAVEATLVDRALSIDEDTVLVIGEGGLDVVGGGSVWQAVAHESGVHVSTLRGAS